MSNRVVYQNGEYVDEKDAKVSIFDSALMFGDMVFEMTRSFNKVQFKLEDHIDRLMRGIKIYRIPINISKNQLIDICHETVKKNEKSFEDNDEHRLMINVSRGPLSIYSHIFDNPEPTLIVADFPLRWTVSSMGKLYEEGLLIKEDLEESKKYYDTCLSIPFYQSLKLKEIKYIKNIIKKFFDI